jgi:hypothetical protein
VETAGFFIAGQQRTHHPDALLRTGFRAIRAQHDIRSTREILYVLAHHHIAPHHS